MSADIDQNTDIVKERVDSITTPTPMQMMPSGWLLGERTIVSLELDS